MNTDQPGTGSVAPAVGVGTPGTAAGDDSPEVLPPLSVAVAVRYGPRSGALGWKMNRPAVATVEPSNSHAWPSLLE